MDKKQIKIMTIVGTRPEIIRLSCVIPTLDKYFNHIFVYTNQSYDNDLSTVFFRDFKLRKPNYSLSVKADSVGQQFANIFIQIEDVLKKENPDAVLILGDTNTALSAIIVKRMNILLFHMEAGNRSFDSRVPEELNRKIIDHLSDYNLAYTEHSRRYLIREGIAQNKIFVTGSPFAEIISKYKKQIDASTVLSDLKLQRKKYFVASIHREENIDDARSLHEVFTAINNLVNSYNIPLILSLHPRTEKRIKSENISLHKKILVHKPLGYFDYNKLQKESLCTISDSGSIQEDSAILGFNAIQIRRSTERPEAFDSGSIIVCGIQKDAVYQSVKLAIESGKTMRIPDDYQEIYVSEKVAKLLLGFTSIAIKP